VIITECTKRKTKVQKRLREDTAEVDKDEIDEVMLKNNPDGNYDEVNMLRERVNTSVWEDRFDRDAVRDGDDDDEKSVGRYVYEMPVTRAVMGDTTDAGASNMGYEASIEAHQGREPNMHEKPEVREMMIKTNPNGKHDETEQLLKVLGYKLTDDEQNLHGDDDDHDVSNVENLSRQTGRTPLGGPMTKSLGNGVFKNTRDGKDKIHEKPETRHKVKYDKNNTVKTQPFEKTKPRDGMHKIIFKPVIKSLGEAAFENILDKDCGEPRGYKKPEMRAVIADIKDYQGRKLIVYEKPEPRDRMLKTNPKEIKMFEEPEMRMLKTTLKGKYNKNV
jgi:hypothetical protein